MNTNTLKQINPDEIAANPHNPRLYFKEDEMESLRESINKVGILVPVTLYENKKKIPKEKYILLDGERRWRCAKHLGLSTVPANIIDEPEDITQNILYMFNIHHFRTEWEIFPTALKLEIIIDKLENDNENILHEFTGLSRSTIRRCKMLLWYPAKFREYLLEKNTKISPEFLIELYPIIQKLAYKDEFLNKFAIDDFIESISRKYLSSDIFQLKDLRDIRRALSYYSDNNNIDVFLSKLQIFISTESGLEIFITDDIQNDKNRRVLIKSIISLNEYVKVIDPDAVSDIEFINNLSELMTNLNKLLTRIE
ncbi:MAG: ParB/RepB/Spo0J family partition protein [Spirochaetota bacterium]